MSYRIPMSNSCGGTNHSKVRLVIPRSSPITNLRAVNRFAASFRRAFVSRQDDECALLLAKRIPYKQVVVGVTR
jgi:hypothetical protein